ncbi:MAG: lipoprotein N-acyltransferase Lnb domain-containing protein [Rudaea sp.]
MLLFPFFSFAQPLPAPEPGADLDVALITFGPGTELWERFGHNAILIADRASGVQRLYNYGMFDFAQKDFYLNFARGRMLYRIAVDDPAEEFPQYRAAGRWIVEQDLNLTPAQRAKLSDYLAWNARPENAQYHYDYFTANCATRVRDALDMTLGGAIHAQLIAPSRGFTYRMDALRLMRPDPVLMVLMDAGLGPFADTRLSYWAESFVPMEFMRYVREVKVRGADGALVPLVARETVIYPGRLPEPPAFPPDWVWQALAIGVLSGFGLLALARRRMRAWARATFATSATLIALVCGVSGLVLIGLWTLTDHVAAWHNENILLLNPLCLLLLPAWFASARAQWQPSRFVKATSFLIAFLAALEFFLKIYPSFPQDNRFWIALLLPIHAVLAAVVNWRKS